MGPTVSHRARSLVAAVVLTAAAALLAGCGAAADGPGGANDAALADAAEPEAPAADAAVAAVASSAPVGTSGPTLDANGTTPAPAPVGSVPIRSGDPTDVFATRAVPVGLDLGDGGRGAPVVPVGVAGDGSLEVPGRSDVGWYAFGPRPGEAGAAVLAAHVDYDGLPGAFFALADVEVGRVVAVSFDDGAVRRFRVVSVDRYDKDALPADVVWRRDGDPALVLVTCGGAFDPDARSYEDNVVVVAVPLA